MRKKSPYRVGAKGVLPKDKLNNILKASLYKLHHSESRHRLERGRQERQQLDHKFLNTSEFLPAHRSVFES